MIERIDKLLPGEAGQRRALAQLVRFVALMLIFTLVTRGVAGAALARVEAATPYPGEIVQAVGTSGRVEAAASLAIPLPPGLSVTELLVVPGQRVKAGEAIARLDATQLTEVRKRAQLKLDELELKLTQLRRQTSHDGSPLAAAQNALRWAEEDYAAAVGRRDAAVAEAGAAVESAEAALAALWEASAHPDEIRAAEEAVLAARAARDAAGQDGDDAVRGAAQKLEAARTTLAAAQTADAEARQQAADTTAQNTLQADGLEIDIAEQQELVATLNAITDGTLNAPADGVVLALEGQDADGEQLVARLSQDSGGYRAVATLPAGEANKLTTGAAVEIVISDGYGNSNRPGAGTLLSVSAANGEGLCEIIVRLPDAEWIHGQTVELRAEISRQQYTACLPFSALGQGADGYFVYEVEQHSGILGAENIVRRRPVTLLAHSDGMAAIEGGLLGGQVVTASTKPLADGDRVRVALS